MNKLSNFAFVEIDKKKNKIDEEALHIYRYMYKRFWLIKCFNRYRYLFYYYFRYFLVSEWGFSYIEIFKNIYQYLYIFLFFVGTVLLYRRYRLCDFISLLQ